MEDKTVSSPIDNVSKRVWLPTARWVLLPCHPPGNEVRGQGSAKTHSLTRSVTTHAQPVLRIRDATSCRSKIIGKEVLLLVTTFTVAADCVCTEHVQSFLVSLFPKEYSVTAVYVVLGITSNLEMR